MKRREFFKTLGLAVAASPLLGIFSKSAFAEKCTAKPKPEKLRVLDPKSKTAERLAYVEDGTSSKHDKYKAGANCLGCKYYKPSSKDPKDLGWAKCTMAGNKYVVACGWCKQYKAK